MGGVGERGRGRRRREGEKGWLNKDYFRSPFFTISTIGMK